MKRVTQVVQSKILVTCYSHISGIFADMINNKVRPKDYNWAGFEAQMVKECVHKIKNQLKTENKVGPEIIETTSLFASQIARNLVGRSNVLGLKRTFVVKNDRYDENRELLKTYLFENAHDIKDENSLYTRFLEIVRVYNDLRSLVVSEEEPK